LTPQALRRPHRNTFPSKEYGKNGGVAQIAAAIRDGEELGF
jgi:hypothetical protein